MACRDRGDCSHCWLFGRLFSAAETPRSARLRGRMHQLERDGDRAAAARQPADQHQETLIGARAAGQQHGQHPGLRRCRPGARRSVSGAVGVGSSAAAVMTVLVADLRRGAAQDRGHHSRPTTWRSLARRTRRPRRAAVRRRWSGCVQWFVRKPAACSASASTWRIDVLAAHEEIRGAVEYHHSEGLVEAATATCSAACSTCGAGASPTSWSTAPRCACSTPTSPPRRSSRRP